MAAGTELTLATKRHPRRKFWCFLILVPGDWVQNLKHFKHWLVVSTPLKNINQLALLFSIYGKIKNVPNHQPEHI
jgi:hypothetical protein